MKFHKMFDTCPQCDGRLHEIAGGSAGNVSGREWYWETRDCRKCGIRIQLTQTRKLAEGEWTNPEKIDVRAGPHKGARCG